MRLVGTSWKMTKTLAQARAWSSGLLAAGVPDGVTAFVVPAHTALAAVAGQLAGSAVAVGAQDAHEAPEGAWTGEVSMGMVADAGATFVELGHSERREHLGDTDERVAAKVTACVRAGLRPLLCCGEPAPVRAADGQLAHVRAQVSSALAGLTAAAVADAWIAYEPVWAIGESGRPAQPGDVAPVVAAIREQVGEDHGRDAAAGVRVLYGGSVDPANAAGLLAVPGTDGLFVGRSAWDVQGFLTLLGIAARA